MKLLKATMFNMDKPNKNNRYYSREVIDNGSSKFCEEYLYLYDRMPTNEENTLPPENIIGTCLEMYWSNNDTQLLNVFQLREDKTKDIDFTKMYPAMFGTGTMNADGNITEFNLEGFGLCENPAYETKIEIIDIEGNYVRECSKGQIISYDREGY